MTRQLKKIKRVRLPISFLKPKLTHARLREVLDYDPEAGVFTWRVYNKRAVKGAVAGCIGDQGGQRVRLIGIDGRMYSGHRLAYFWMEGTWPPFTVDHKDCDTTNNRWDNLRLATVQQQLCNRRVQRNNKFGLKGVWTHPSGQGYIGGIGSRWLGVYETPEEAHAAYVEEAKRQYGEFARAA